MNTRKIYLRTDLASESRLTSELGEAEGVIYSEREQNGTKIVTLEITNQTGADNIGKPIGKYITIHFGKIWLRADDEFEATVEILANEIKSLANSIVKRSDNCYSVLVAGLGNQYITPDAIGPQSVKGITVTRHIKEMQLKLFDAMGYYDISAITPGVLGQTGIETVELIRGVAENVKPSLVVVIDALASRSTERLGTTVQLTDNGISPGSGIGNDRKAINEKTIGVPVLVIGVPTVVDSSTLVYDALEKAGISDISSELETVLENGRGFFVSLKDSDIIISEISRLISQSFNVAFTKSE